MKKTKCPRVTCKNDAIIDAQYGVLPCSACTNRDEATVAHIKKMPRYLTLSERDRIVPQQDRFAKDMLQPFVHGNDPNPEFVKAYPELRNNYFTPEQLKKL